MNPPTCQQTQSIHELYNRLTGLAIPYSMQRHFHWEQWLVRGHTTQDLELVIRYLRSRVSDGKRQRECLLFRNVIANVESFEEDLSMARSNSRDRRHTLDPARESVLQSSRIVMKEKSPEKPAVNVVQVMEQHALMAKLLHDWKENGFNEPEIGASV